MTKAQKIALGKQNAASKVAELRRLRIRLSKSDVCAIYAQERLVALGQFEKNFKIVTEKMGEIIPRPKVVVMRTEAK
jgi:hypothetical protein